jgi:hypothetical protein
MLVAAVILIPAGVYASHQFVDVPNSHVFHNSIDWMKDNNITVGCNPPANNRYCREDNVTRGQMATFLKRLAENNVVDAATLDGLDSSDFVRADPSQSITLGAGSFTADGVVADWSNGCVRNSAGTFDVRAGIQLPVGVIVTSMRALLVDGNGANGTVLLRRVNTANSTLASATSSGSVGLTTVTANLAMPAPVESGDYFNVEYSGGDGTASHQICGIEIFYDNGGLIVQGNDSPPSGPAPGSE